MFTARQTKKEACNKNVHQIELTFMSGDADICENVSYYFDDSVEGYRRMVNFMHDVEVAMGKRYNEYGDFSKDMQANNSACVNELGEFGCFEPEYDNKCDCGIMAKLDDVRMWLFDSAGDRIECKLTFVWNDFVIFRAE